MAAPQGNRYAAKEVARDSKLEVRCLREEKAAWIAAANAAGTKLAPWVTSALNEAARRSQGNC